VGDGALVVFVGGSRVVTVKSSVEITMVLAQKISLCEKFIEFVDKHGLPDLGIGLPSTGEVRQVAVAVRENLIEVWQFATGQGWPDDE
jgi:hypothetical protein